MPRGSVRYQDQKKKYIYYVSVRVEIVMSKQNEIIFKLLLCFSVNRKEYLRYRYGFVKGYS